MRTHMRVAAESLAGELPTSAHGARIDPIVYVTEARRAQARAVAEALGAARRNLRRGFGALAGIGLPLLERLARRSERRRAIAQLSALDGRLLADIGLRRSDIELAVDGLLADPRVTRRGPGPAGAPANSNRPVAATPPDHVTDLAA